VKPPIRLDSPPPELHGKEQEKPRIGWRAWILVTAPLAVAIVSVSAVRADRADFAYPDAPPPGRTGGFGEPTCRACHFDGELNAAGGTLTISGVPEFYTPGQPYRLVVSLQRREMQAGGFQVAARFAGGRFAGRQAGALRALNDGVQVTTLPSGVEYASQTRHGIQLTAEGRIEWTLEWRAPDPAAGEVVFHVAGNAANHDASPLGDFVYTTMERSQAR
jgi:hypothetical protein